MYLLCSFVCILRRFLSFIGVPQESQCVYLYDKGVGGVEGVRCVGFCWHSTRTSQLRFASTSIVNKTIYTELHDLHSLLVSVLKAGNMFFV